MLLFIKHIQRIIFKRCDIAAGLKDTKCSKACGVDGLAAEQLVHTDDKIVTILATLFNGSIIYGWIRKLL